MKPKNLLKLILKILNWKHKKEHDLFCYSLKDTHLFDTIDLLSHSANYYIIALLI